MSSPSASNSLMADLTRELRELKTSISDQWNFFIAGIRNQIRELRGVKLDYVILPVGGSLPERNPPLPSFIQRQLHFPPPPLSMQALNYRLRVIADAENVTGVVFLFHKLELGLGSLQNLRRSIHRLRESGKQVVVFSPYLDLTHYYAASAADRIIVPPGTQFDVLGLRSEVLFLKDALERIGVHTEAIQISPYKTGPNTFTLSDISPEQREQLDWLLDDWYDMITADMSADRGMSQDQLKQLIDRAPYFAQKALDLGLIDQIAYEDELPFLLAKAKPEDGNTDGTSTPDPSSVEEKDETTTPNPSSVEEKDERPKARLKRWAEASSMLMERPRRYSRKFVGVISLEGAIVMGPSRGAPIDLPLPLLGGATAGEQTLLQLLRQVEEIDDMAALIFHVDSGGGSSLASELIGRQIERIRRKKTVLIYMGDAAASGGYYVSAAAHHIMCQPATVTGSIGVWTLHIDTSELYQSFSVNRVGLERGERADLYSDTRPLTDVERQVYVEGVVKTYEQFKKIVADGRDLPYDELDAICEGRVWTGRQALKHRLVDSHGDFVDAIRKAAELAGLPSDDHFYIPAVNFHPAGSRYVPPLPFLAVDAIAEINRLLSGDLLRELDGRPLLMMPFEIKFR